MGFPARRSLALAGAQSIIWTYVVAHGRVTVTYLRSPYSVRIMHIDLPTDQQTLVENLVASGRFPSVQDAVSEAINMLAAHEKLRKEIQVGVDQADRGALLEHDTVFTQLRSLAATAGRAESGQ